MICLRCGYCCKVSFVAIVDNPELGIIEENIVMKEEGTCKHLSGDEPGNYSCAIHNEIWYEETPCFTHGQIERSPTCECRMGRYILDNQKAKSTCI